MTNPGEGEPIQEFDDSAFWEDPNTQRQVEEFRASVADGTVETTNHDDLERVLVGERRKPAPVGNTVREIMGADYINEQAARRRAAQASLRARRLARIAEGFRRSPVSVWLNPRFKG